MLSKQLKHLLVGTAISVIGTTGAWAKTYEHSLGTVDIDSAPQRVVVLGFGSLDFVDALGVQPVGLPKQLLPEHLAQYKAEQFTNTGSLHEVNFETLFTLKPDLIIAEGRMAKLYKDLADVAPTYMYQIDSKDYWKTTQQHWQNLSEIFDKQDKGAELIGGVQTQIDELAAMNNEAPLSVLTAMSNGSNVTSFGPISRFSFVYKEAGFNTATSKNVEAESRTHGDLISFEYIADAKPEVLLILDRDQAIGKGTGMAQKLFDNNLVESTPAAKNGKIVYLDTAAWYLGAGGYQSTQTMIDDLNRVVR